MTTTELDLTPGSDAWLSRITASKVAAILGVSPYDSPRSMWHKMHGDLPREESNAVQRRGHFLEPGVLAWWMDSYGLTEVEEQVVFHLEDWGAATPDAVASIDGRLVLVEVKTARNPDEWGTPGTDEIPTHYLIQTFWQMHVSGIHEVRIPVLTAFLDFAEYVVVYDPAVGQMLEDTCRAFMGSLQANTPPAIDGTEATYDALRVVFRELDDSTVQIDPEVAHEFVNAKAALKDAEARERAAKSVLIEVMQDAKYAEHNGIRVARRQANKSGTSLVQVAKSLPSVAPDQEVTNV